MVLLRIDAPIHLVLVLELLLHVLEALLQHLSYFLLGSLFKIHLVEKVPVLVSDEVKHFTLRERGHLVAVLTVAIEESVDTHLAVKQDEKVILVGFILPALTTHEFDVLLQE